WALRDSRRGGKANTNQFPRRECLGSMRQSKPEPDLLLPAREKDVQGSYSRRQESLPRQHWTEHRDVSSRFRAARKKPKRPGTSTAAPACTGSECETAPTMSGEN